MISILFMYCLGLFFLFYSLVCTFRSEAPLQLRSSIRSLLRYDSLSIDLLRSFVGIDLDIWLEAFLRLWIEIWSESYSNRTLNLDKGVFPLTIIPLCVFFGMLLCFSEEFMFSLVPPDAQLPLLTSAVLPT